MEIFMKSIFHTSLLLVLLALFTSTSAVARGHGGGHWGGGGGHHHGFGGFYGPSIGFYSGPGFGYGYVFGQPYYAPYYSYPPVVTIQPPGPPPVYIERQDQPVTNPQPQAAAYWYYCRNPEGYYPYVKQCLGTWQQVSPQPSVR